MNALSKNQRTRGQAWVAVLAGVLALAATACGGTVDGNYEADVDEIIRPPKDDPAPVAYADLVVAITSCEFDHFHFVIRNQGTIPTEASACSFIGCRDQFETKIFNGQVTLNLWGVDLGPGEERTGVASRTPGSEGLVRVRVDTWGNNPGHSVQESNENNNTAEAFCVM